MGMPAQRVAQSVGDAGGRHPAPACAPAASATYGLLRDPRPQPFAAAWPHPGGRWRRGSVVRACPWPRVALLEPQGRDTTRKHTLALQAMQARFLCNPVLGEVDSTGNPDGYREVISEFAGGRLVELVGIELEPFGGRERSGSPPAKSRAQPGPPASPVLVRWGV